MDLVEGKVAAISSVDDDEEFEEVEEEVEEEIEEEEEEEEEEKEEEEEDDEEEEKEEEEEEEDDEEDEDEDEEDGNGTVVGESAEKKTVNGPSLSDSGKIFVGGVAWETTEETFAKHFKKYGEIADSVIMKDKHTQKPRGFGFVTYAEPSVIDKVLEDEHVIDGRTVEVKRTVPREDMSSSKSGPKTKRIFVGGLPPSFTDDELKEHFSSYGKVIEHKVMVDNSTGRSRGFGFVTFETEEIVEKITSKGKMHDLGGKQVEIKKAEPKRPAADAASNGRAGHVAVAGNPHNFGGDAYGYGGAYGPAALYYGGGGGGPYARGYGYGGPVGYGAGYGPSFGGVLYGAGGYGASNLYGGYGGGYGPSYGGGASGYGRYHPYGR